MDSLGIIQKGLPSGGQKLSSDCIRYYPGKAHRQHMVKADVKHVCTDVLPAIYIRHEARSPTAVRQQQVSFSYSLDLQCLCAPPACSSLCTAKSQMVPPLGTIWTANKKFGGAVLGSGLEGMGGGFSGSAIKSSFCARFSPWSCASLQYDCAEWEPAFLRQAREFPFRPSLPREASK